MKQYQRKVLERIINHGEKHFHFVAGCQPVMKTRQNDVIITDSHRLVVTSSEVSGYVAEDINCVFGGPLPSLYGYYQDTELPSAETLRAYRRELKKAGNLKNHLRCWPLWNGNGYTFVDSKYLLDAVTLMPSAKSALLTERSPYQPIYIDSADGFEMYICPVRVDPILQNAIIESAAKFMDKVPATA